MRFRYRSSMLAAVPVLLLVAAPVALSAQSGQAPIVMSSGELVGGGTAFELTVRNNTPLAVTAWGVHAEFTYDDGKTRGGTWGGEGVYTFEGIATDESGQRVIPPRATIRARFPISDTSGYRGAAGISVSLGYAVFEDGTAVGSESHIARVFTIRTEDARAWLRVQEALTRARTGAAGRAALARAQSEMAYEDESSFGDHPARGTRVNLSIFADRSRKGLMSDSRIDELLLTLQREAEAKAKAAAKHAVRR
jgi:hypothetical protein